MPPTNPLINPHKWVVNHADYLYAFALSRINDAEQARDLVQEVFLAALEKADKFEGKSAERTWLTAILKNKIVDIYRKRSSAWITNTGKVGEQNELDFFEDDGHWKNEYRPVEFGVEDNDPLHNKEFNQVLEKCLQKLPALWFAVFTLKHIDDETTGNICAQLKVSSSNFWVIIHRTKLNLRACLQKTGSDMGPLKKIQYNCRKATLLIEKKLIDRLTLKETIELRIHLTGCSVCRVFDKQSQLINNLVQQLFNSPARNDLHLDDSYKAALQHRIEEELNKN